MFQVCLVTAVVVLMPWGWRPQLLVAASSLVGFWLVAPRLPASDALQYAVVGLFSAAATSVWGAFFLDRYRRDAFARATLLAHASAVQQEETEIAAALLDVAQSLDVNLGTPDMLERVNALAQGIVGCDMCGTFIWNDEAAAFRLQTSVGLAQPVVDEISGIDFTAEALPIVAILRTGESIEVTAPEGQDYPAGRSPRSSTRRSSGAARRSGSWCTPTASGRARSPRSSAAWRPGSRTRPRSRSRTRASSPISRPPAGSSPTSSRPCRTSCGRRST
jgi:hypothetical protein